MIRKLILYQLYCLIGLREILRKYFGAWIYLFYLLIIIAKSYTFNIEQSSKFIKYEYYEYEPKEDNNIKEQKTSSLKKPYLNRRIRVYIQIIKW